MQHPQRPNAGLRYFVYCRKSTDGEDRQIQSIPDQINVLTELAKRHGLEVIAVLDEAKSAKAPGRPVFTQMIQRISNGEANGIIAWKLNRLARNPIDGGTISWMLQQGVVQHILTAERSYYPHDNVLLMAVELGIANQYLRDLSADVKRGIRNRENTIGYPNGVAPIGFLNDLSKPKGQRGWTVDEVRYPIVKQLLERFESGQCSIRQIVRIANEEMGLRTPEHRKQGGRPLVLSYVASTLLRNPVYAGFFFVSDGSRRDLTKAMPRMISEEQFWHIQQLLGSKGRPRPSKMRLQFAYVGFMSCGGCEGSVTAEHKYQLICPQCKTKFAYRKADRCPRCQIDIAAMIDPTYLHYIYYHCTRTKNPQCKEGSIREADIDSHLVEHFEKRLYMSQPLAQWCIDHLNVPESDDAASEHERRLSLEKTLFAKKREDGELVLMRARNLLDDSAFVAARTQTAKDIELLEQQLSSLRPLSENELKQGRHAFEVASDKASVFGGDSVQRKRALLLETRSNLTLKEKKVTIYPSDLYDAIMRGLLAAQSANALFEPGNCLAERDKSGVFASVRSTLLRMVNDVRTLLKRNGMPTKRHEPSTFSLSPQVPVNRRHHVRDEAIRRRLAA